jgi:hypothetical protein
MTRLFTLVAAGICCTACAGDHNNAAASTAKPQTSVGCIPGGGGLLQAQLRGAVTADLNWRNADMECAGGPRPDGKGVRLTLAGKLQGTAGSPPRQLRFIFGVEQRDIASGAAQALPTNLTVILEGEQQLYATRGATQCAVEAFELTPLAGSNSKINRVHARGYCIGPATNVAGDARLLVPTFEFTTVADTELEP